MSKNLADIINKVHCADCLEFMRDMPDECVDLVITDPPYNVGISEWDSIPNYEEWLLGVFIECERILKPNGTLWFFHMVFATLAKLQISIEAKTSFRHKQFITIDKGIESVAGRCSFDTLRSFPRASEYLQFYTFKDRTGAEQLSEKYARINPMVRYLRDEFAAAGVSNREIAVLFPSKTGGLTGCVSNWLLGLNFPTEEQYMRMRDYLNGAYLRREYEDLRREYEDLRREYEDLRYTFNLKPGLTDVIKVNMCKESRYGHVTPKPRWLIETIIETGSHPSDLILDPFLGSGTTAVAAKQLGRNFIGVEINPEYCKIAEERLKQEVLPFNQPKPEPQKNPDLFEVSK